MSLHLIPKLKGHGRRRAVDEVDKLREDVTRLLNFKAAADDFFAVLTEDRDEVYAAWRWAEQRRQEAETVAACAMSERNELADEIDRLRAELAPFKAAEANAHRIDVPPMVRPVDGPEDEATAPIDVRPLREAAAAGLLGPVTDPGRIA